MENEEQVTGQADEPLFSLKRDGVIFLVNIIDVASKSGNIPINAYGDVAILYGEAMNFLAMTEPQENTDQETDNSESE